MDTYIYARLFRGSRANRAGRLALGAIVLSSGLLSGCTRAGAQPAAPLPQKVTVAEVFSRDISEWDEFTGRVEAVHIVAVRPRVSGYVSAVRFQEGAIVRRGDLLFQIDPRPFQVEVDRLVAEAARARATVRRAVSELQRAERLAAENAMSHEEHERRESAAQESAAQASASEAALAAAQLNLEFTRVTSPIDGRVGRAIVTEGNLVAAGPGEATLLTTVVSLDPIYASFDADEQTFLRYGDLARTGNRPGTGQAGLPVQLELTGDQASPREGTMNFLDNQVDPTTGTIRGRAVFRNADRGLTPGLFVRLRLPGTGKYRGVLIQDRAVGTDLDKRFVFVVGKGRTIQYRAVTLGPLVEGLRVVRSGLAHGDLVVVSGLQRVRPGMQVDPATVAMGSSDAAASGGATAAGK